MDSVNLLERALRRDRMVLIAVMTCLAAFAALYTLFGVGMRLSAVELTARIGAPAAGPGKVGIMVIAPEPWTPGHIARVFLTWWMVVIASVLPAAASVVLVHASISRKAAAPEGAIRRSWAFLGGYLGAWAGFSLVVTVAQWVMTVNGMVSPAVLIVTSNVLAGAIMLAAGLYQFSQFKHDCLAVFRHPGRRLADDYRPGLGAAAQLGLEHGAYCVGSCWFLLLLLFFGGILNLYWILGLGVLFVVEKGLPRGESIGLGVGSVLILWGILFLVSATGII